MITKINESETLTKNILCKCKCKHNGRKCNSDQMWNNSKIQCKYKNPRNHYMWEKDYIWNPSTCTYENDTLFRVLFRSLFDLLLLLNYFNYLESIIYDSVVTCD